MYYDSTGGAFVAELKAKLIEKAREYAIKHSYDGFYLGDDSIKCEVVYFASPFHSVKYRLTGVADFYRLRNEL